MLQTILIAHGNIYNLADIHNMYDSADVKFNFFNEPYLIVDGTVIDLTKEALSFIAPLGKFNTDYR